MECLWVDTIPDTTNWIISGVVNDENGPNVDYKNDTSGHFLYDVNGRPGTSISEIESPVFRNSQVRNTYQSH